MSLDNLQTDRFFIYKTERFLRKLLQAMIVFDTVFKQHKLWIETKINRGRGRKIKYMHVRKEKKIINNERRWRRLIKSQQRPAVFKICFEKRVDKVAFCNLLSLSRTIKISNKFCIISSQMLIIPRNECRRKKSNNNKRNNINISTNNSVDY